MGIFLTTIVAFWVFVEFVLPYAVAFATFIYIVKLIRDSWRKSRRKDEERLIRIARKRTREHKYYIDPDIPDMDYRLPKDWITRDIS